MGDDDNGSLVL